MCVAGQHSIYFSMHRGTCHGTTAQQSITRLSLMHLQRHLQPLCRRLPPRLQGLLADLMPHLLPLLMAMS